jgi:hypothetical protein
MPKKNETTEAEIVSEVVLKTRKSNAGLFWGTLLLVWGVALILDNYLQIDVFRNFWPVVAIIFGGFLILSSFNR